MDFLKLTKISFYSIFATILFIVGVYAFAMTIPFWTPEFLDLEYSHNLSNAIPVNIQVHRVLSYASLILSILAWTLTFINILKIEDKKTKNIYLLSGGIFTWLLLPYTLFKCIKENYYKQYIAYISREITSNKTISFKELKEMKKNHLFWNTIFSVFMWVVSFVGFIFLFATPYYYDAENSKTNFLIGELSYFTNLSNWSIFFFMSFYLFFNRKMVFEYNTIMIGLSAYITVVFIIFWAALFPYTAKGIEEAYKLSEEGPTGLISTIWVHAITPFIFVLYSISSLFLSKTKPKSFSKTLIKLLVFPATYGVYIFSLPFFTQFSVYGNITNLNPKCIPYYDAVYNGDVPYVNGSPMMILVIVGLFSLFIALIFLFWFIAMKTSNNKIKVNLK